MKLNTAVSSEAWAKLRDWASVAGRGRLLLSGSVAHASLETAVLKLESIKARIYFGTLHPLRSCVFQLSKGHVQMTSSVRGWGWVGKKIT